ncbi:hypothetical protein [Nocardia rhizosphaerihabitans]|uniref:ASCH domain-containing protein n=1 Tax=Nocardia rhizosphaerihabitans TaxID=1691570 RepID=A0ABQ2KXD9_9NOCA|nr:hypothetical protein [Nocardia rhizosphaerihabitans]GGN96049.1 hypothetical protein GCM10011610_60700 [Nocardia rhizosphaerihabitans]
MILTDRIARGVAAGEVSTVFRRWAAPRVRVGGTLHTSAGIVEIVRVDRIEPHEISNAAAHRAGERDAEAVKAALRGSPQDPVFRIEVRYVGPDERVALRSDADLSSQDVAEISAALARLDKASRRGPWTDMVLAAVAEHPGRRAADLAERLGRDKDSFKLDVRKLKNLGLTHSLETGYEISPRGAAYLRAIAG